MYALYGRGREYVEHMKAGTNRAAAYASSMGSPEEFIAYAEAQAAAHSRKYETYNLVLAGDPKVFDVRNPDDIKKMLGLSTGLTEAAFSAEYEYLDQDMGGHRLRGVPVNAAGDFLADRTWSVTEPTDFTTLKAHVAQVRWDQAFARGIRLDSTLRYLQYDREEEYHEPRGITANGLFMQRNFRKQLRTNDDVSWNAALSIPWTMGKVTHDIAVGGDAYRQDHLFRFAQANQRSAGGPVQDVGPSFVRAPTRTHERQRTTRRHHRRPHSRRRDRQVDGTAAGGAGPCRQVDSGGASRRGGLGDAVR